jgi:glycosidase
MKPEQNQATGQTPILDHLQFLYGPETAATLWPAVLARLTTFPKSNRPHRSLSQTDAILITYGDMVQETGRPPLQTLQQFLTPRLKGIIPTVHLLPFYPYSSDDGFSVIDYTAVDPALGTWADIASLGRHFRLMFDAVINHISAESDWFQAFLCSEPPYDDYFVAVPEGVDLSQVFRPRTLPLLTPIQTAEGQKLLWTTFSPDQIDLNFQNPAVLLAILDVLLFYLEQGAEYLRLDAIAYLWKTIGTSSIHLPQTHRLIQFFRAALDHVAPHTVLITETNVPHPDNIAYFGDGRNEAQMVYNFSLPPLTLHAFHQGDATTLSNWASTLTLPSDQVTFFNFLASHDGIGVTPARGILSPAAITALAQRVEALGGHVSYRSNPDGSQTPYELNINYLDALGNPTEPHETAEQTANRFLAAQAIMLALRGVPGIYFHSFFGSRSWPAGVAQTGRPRTINRQKLDRHQLEQELDDPHTLRHRVYHGYRHLLQARQAAGPAFHPTGDQQILFWHPALFALRRTSPDGRHQLLCLHNVSPQPVQLTLPPTGLPTNQGQLTDLLTSSTYPLPATTTLTLAPYQVQWLKPTP